MPTAILTYLKTMSKILTIPRFYGPLATVLFTGVYHLAAGYFSFTITYGWLWLALVIGASVGGLWAGLICGAWVTLYAALTLPFYDDPSRAIQIGLISIIGAWLIGYIRQREHSLQRAMYAVFANGNVIKMREALALATEMKLNLSTYSEAGLLDGLEKIESDIGNTLAVLDGYRFLREEIERVNEWYANPGNVDKLQKMRDGQ